MKPDPLMKVMTDKFPALLLTVLILLAPIQAQTSEGRMRGRRINPPVQSPAPVIQQSIPADQETSVQAEELNGPISFASPFSTRILRFDVAENGRRFVFDETPLFDDGAPAYGNEFVTEGYIYPFGMLNGTNGVNADGSPEFPDKVIGKWVCRGWHVGEGAKTVTGPWVVTHQLYDFADQPGRVSLATDGFELVDLNVPIQRAIIGGTGQYAQARGEATQTMLGFNQTLGVVLRFELRVTK
jgi:hypothetical protein